MKDAIRYIVTVEAVTQREESTGQEWAVVTQKTVPGSDKPENVYGYTPEIIKTIRREVQVYEQSVESLDMPALVLVVNGLVSNPN